MPSLRHLLQLQVGLGIRKTFQKAGVCTFDTKHPETSWCWSVPMGEQHLGMISTVINQQHIAVAYGLRLWSKLHYIALVTPMFAVCSYARHAYHVRYTLSYVKFLAPGLTLCGAQADSKRARKRYPTSKHEATRRSDLCLACAETVQDLQVAPMLGLATRGQHASRRVMRSRLHWCRESSSSATREILHSRVSSRPIAYGLLLASPEKPELKVQQNITRLRCSRHVCFTVATK